MYSQNVETRTAGSTENGKVNPIGVAIKSANAATQTTKSRDGSKRWLIIGIEGMFFFYVKEISFLQYNNFKAYRYLVRTFYQPGNMRFFSAISHFGLLSNVFFHVYADDTRIKEKLDRSSLCPNLNLIRHTI